MRTALDGELACLSQKGLAKKSLPSLSRLKLAALDLQAGGISASCRDCSGFSKHLNT
jgi:hypothetical protein